MEEKCKKQIVWQLVLDAEINSVFYRGKYPK